MAERKQVQKAQRVEWPFIAEVFPDFGVQTFDVGEYVAVRNDDTTRFGRRSRGVDDLECVLAGQRGRWVRRGIATSQNLAKRFQFERRKVGAVLVATRTEHQFRVDVVGHVTSKFDW